MTGITSENILKQVLDTWQINNRITIYLIECLPEKFWEQRVMGYSRKTVRMIFGHLHNTRCMWIKMTGGDFGISSPESLNRYKATREETATSLKNSSKVLLELFEEGFRSGKKLPGFSLSTIHFLNYLVAHEAHHRGQITMLAKQAGIVLNDEITYGLWKWKKRAREVQN